MTVARKRGRASDSGGRGGLGSDVVNAVSIVIVVVVSLVGSLLLFLTSLQAWTWAVGWLVVFYGAFIIVFFALALIAAWLTNWFLYANGRVMPSSMTFARVDEFTAPLLLALAGIAFAGVTVALFLWEFYYPVDNWWSSSDAAYTQLPYLIVLNGCAVILFVMTMLGFFAVICWFIIRKFAALAVVRGEEEGGGFVGDEEAPGFSGVTDCGDSSEDEEAEDHKRHLKKRPKGKSSHRHSRPHA